jgi:alpha-tubulin suppressor-like RCC1 family protein
MDHSARQRSRGLVSLSKDETILLSPSGDVVTCRCRDSALPSSSAALDSQKSKDGGAWNGYQWDLADQAANLCCEANCDDLSNQLQATALCGAWGGSLDSGDDNDNGIPPSPFRAKRVGSDDDDNTHNLSLPPRRRNRGGLLGGNPADVAAPFLQHPTTPFAAGLQGGGSYFRDSADPTFREQAAVAFRSPPLRTSGRASGSASAQQQPDDLAVDDESSIVPIRSFDYSHFYSDNGNDMLPDTPRQRPPATVLRSPDRLPANFLQPTLDVASDDAIVAQPYIADSYHHGIPTFLRSFAAIRIQMVSANPLGSHVLLISNAGLLYSYGLNDCGQLGVGVRTSVAGFHRGYVTTPTIVTPLVENGGKAICCSAGVNHSLVVVETEERRIIKTRSFDHEASSLSATAGSASSRSLDPRGPAKSTATETIVYHQIYGFGRNDSMKIGLIRPRGAAVNGVVEAEVEHVLLPRRVALRCRVQQLYDVPPHVAPEALPPLGIFDIQASAEHSSALVHRGTGEIELYTWGNATFGALGCSTPKRPTMTSRPPSSSSLSAPYTSVPSVPISVVPIPSVVASLSMSDNDEAKATSLLLDGEFPVSCSLGRRSSFVLTCFGRCFAFGTSEEGMLGLGPKITESSRPTELALPVELRGEGLTVVSAGVSHVLACTEGGRVLAWGSKIPSGLELRNGSNNNGGGSSNNSTSSKTVTTQESGSHDEHIQWSPRQVVMSTKSLPSQDYRVVSVGAGYDCSLFVTESGRVLSCGLSSGRLGLGERVGASQTTTAPDEPSSTTPSTKKAIVRRRVPVPQPLWGGLRLWYRRSIKPAVLAPPGRPGKPVMHRGVTIS